MRSACISILQKKRRARDEACQLMNAYIKELLREEREAVLMHDWKRATEIAQQRIAGGKYELS